jgi:hypothetical protein
MRPLIPVFVTLGLALALNVSAQTWMQWGANSRHDSNSTASGHRLEKIETEMILDKFADFKKAAGGGSLLAHYPVPLVDGIDVVVVTRGGEYTTFQTPQSQIWNVVALRRGGATGALAERWTYATDWKPVPMNSAGAPSWEPVYHVVMTADAVWAPGAGGTIIKLDRSTGAVVRRVNPFGIELLPDTYVTGPPAVDGSGNIYYNAMQLDRVNPWTADPVNSWLVKVRPDGTSSIATYASLTANAPAPDAQCTTQFSANELPWPPSPDAVAPTTRCGAQRPGINVAPAVAPDGTVYTVSRAHLNERWSFMIAANADLTPKWSSTMRNRLNDGCGVLLPPNGTPGGCRAGSPLGVDPADNQLGSGRVTDLSTSSPVVLPDGNILYGAQTRYNYVQGHLMMYSPIGNFLRAYEFGWDITPAVYQHDGTYSIVIKENRYQVSSYCNSAQFCPSNRSTVTPNDPEQYFITQLSPQLQVEWKFKNTETQSCFRDADGVQRCTPDHPRGFEWCVNGLAIDRNGITYANAEDGYIYAIDSKGRMLSRIFMRLALGAAYTPLAIGGDGRIYTQNDGRLFVITQSEGRRRRAAATR